MGFGKVQATFSDICVLLLTQNWKKAKLKTDPRFEVILSNLAKTNPTCSSLQSTHCVHFTWYFLLSA